MPNDATFLALADPVRRRMLDDLRRGERSATDLARPHPISQPAISRHLRVLSDAGLVEARRQGRHRMFRLSPHRLDETLAWLERLRDAMESNYARLDALLAEKDDDDAL